MKKTKNYNIEDRLTIETELRNLFDLAFSVFGKRGINFLTDEANQVSRNLKRQLKTKKL